MTSTPLRPPPVPPATGSPLRAGAVAAGWAVLLGLICTGLPVLLVWAADSRSGAGALDAVRAAAQVWLVAHGTVLELPGGRLGLVPLGLLLLPGLLLLRAGAGAAREDEPADLPAALRLTAALTATYTVLVTAVAGLVSTGAARPLPLTAAVCAATLAAGVGGAAVLRTAGLAGAARAALPAGLRRLLRPAAGALAVLLGAGALLAGTALALSAGDAADLARATAPGRVGGLALLVLGLALVPVAVVWGAAWLAGPGFAVGLGTTAGPFTQTLGAVPAVPLLAALPGGALPVWAAVAVLAVPLAGGALAGRLLLAAGPARLRDAGLVGLLAGAGVSVLTLAASGPVGSGRLSAVGPSTWQVALAVTAEVALGALAALALRRWRERRATA